MPVSIANGSTDVTQYFVMRDSTNHAPKTDVTITDIDLYYQEELVAQAAKVDATALAAADSAHADNKGYHCGNGLYRIDWPDAAFDGGVGKKVILIVVCTGCDTIFREVQLGVNVGTNADKTGYGLADDAITSAKFDESTAFPLKSADTGSTAVARTGADSDTLETLSDQLDTIDDYLDTELAAITAAVITNAAGADIAADIIAMQGDVTDVLADTALLIEWLKNKITVTDNENGTHTLAVRNAGDTDDILSWVVTDATGARAANTV